MKGHAGSRGLAPSGPLMNCVLVDASTAFPLGHPKRVTAGAGGIDTMPDIVPSVDRITPNRARLTLSCFHLSRFSDDIKLTPGPSL